MFNKKSFFGLLSLFVFSGLYSQEAKMTVLQIIKKATETYVDQKYINYNTTYNLYLDYKAKKVYEQYFGIVLKKDNINYFKVKNTEFVVFKKYGVKINNDQKAMIIGENKDDIQQSPISLLNYLEGFKYKFINPNADTYECELVPANKISQIMIGKVILSIKKSDFSLNKQTVYYIENMESKNNNGKIVQSIPRLEIIFSKRIKNDKQDNLLLRQESYFTLASNKIVVSPRLSTYKLFKS